MNTPRRLFLRAALPSATLSIAVMAGLLRPATSQAADFPNWFQPFKFPASPPPNTPPFSMPAPVAATAQPEATGVVGELIKAFRGAHPIDSTNIQLIAPNIAENGASVFIEINTRLPDVDGLLIFVERNPQPLAAAFWLLQNDVSELKTRIKVAQTSAVTVVARSRGQFFKTTQLVKITVGGCSANLS